MSREGNEADVTPPRSIADAEEYQNKHPPSRNGLYSPAARSRNSEALRDLANSPVSYDGKLILGGAQEDEDDEDEADSVEQNGQRSEFGGQQALPIREPGPNDLPGPHYPSYDSGPSFGNFGPMPDEGRSTPLMSTWTPNWANSKPMPPVPRELTPGYVNVPLPESVASPRASSANLDTTSVNIGVESPSSPRSRAMPSQASRKAPTMRSEQQATGSSNPMQGGDDNRPWSPSARSRITTKTREGTAYPVLPESRMGDDLSTSPTRSKAVRSKASSESPSQTKVQSTSRKEPSMNPAGRGDLSPRSSHRNIASPTRSAAGFSGNGQSHQNRPFSPYRHAPTTEDLLHAAVRGRALVLPDPSIPPSPSSQHSRAPSAVPSVAARSQAQSRTGKAPSAAQSHKTASIAEQGGAEQGEAATPRPRSPLGLESRGSSDRSGRSRVVAYASYFPLYRFSSRIRCCKLAFPLTWTCDPSVHEVVKKALRKAIRQRVKRLGMKHDNESIKQYRKMHDHDPSVHLHPDDLVDEEPPKWATDLKREIVLMQQRIESLGPKIEGLRAPSHAEESNHGYEGEPEQYTETPATRTINIQAQPTGTLAESMYQHPETDEIPDDNEEGSDDATETPRDHPLRTESDGLSQHRNIISRDDSPGQQYLEEELYKLRQKPHGSNSRLSHHSWEVARDDEPDYDEEHGEQGPSPTGLQTIPDRDSNAADPAPGQDAQQEVAATPQRNWNAGDVSHDPSQHLPPWQRIHQRLLSWAIIWPASDFDAALNSTTRNQQVNEVALTIWSTQTYKRYVRAKLTDSPQGVVDRFNAVFNGRHGDACGMLRDLWSPFGLEGMPRLIIVLAKHRSDPNHWVVHRFSLPEGALTTYDSYPERTLPDGRSRPSYAEDGPSPSPAPSSRWIIPSPLVVCGATPSWDQRAERSLDLERLRDLINTEVKNLRQKKQIGKLRPRRAATLGVKYSEARHSESSVCISTLIAADQDASGSSYPDGKPDTPFEKMIQLLNHQSFPSARLARIDDLVVYAMFATKARPESYRAFKPDTISGATMTADQGGAFNGCVKMHVDPLNPTFATCQEAAKEVMAKLPELFGEKLCYKVDFARAALIRAGAYLLHACGSLSSNLHKPGHATIEATTQQLGPTGSRLILGPLRFVNHDCNPNSQLYPIPNSNAFTIITLRQIEAGESITVKYTEGGYWGECLYSTLVLPRREVVPVVKNPDKKQRRGGKRKTVSINGVHTRIANDRGKLKIAPELVPPSYVQAPPERRRKKKPAVSAPPTSPPPGTPPPVSMQVEKVE
ncbi:hypothetical protein B0H16DRAFT_1447328 [Mycena metata]|uniref:SET domain-containing protein n=1 Tax=Mycena metata TaxID=1033252 RepID=A0AAD7KEP9_9AGAR|nr:hypothetical protein B0H16DRAFT_1447328 [Mycena metata]